MSRRGRPRDTDVDERVLDTATGLLLEHGYGGLSTDAVAERTGIAKTTLYRRWPTKDHLAVAVVTRLQDADEITDTGDVRRDLTAYLGKIAAALERMRTAGRPDAGPSAGTVAELVAAAARHDDIGELERAMYDRRNRLAYALIEAARERGELRPGTDPEVLLDQLAGALYYRVLITGNPVDRDYTRRLVAAALDGALTDRSTP